MLDSDIGDRVTRLAGSNAAVVTGEFTVFIVATDTQADLDELVVKKACDGARRHPIHHIQRPIDRDISNRNPFGCTETYIQGR